MIRSKLINYFEINSFGCNKEEMDRRYPDRVLWKEDKIESDEPFEADAKSTRYCRKCAKALRQSRYFYHPHCDPFAKNDGVFGYPDESDILSMPGYNLSKRRPTPRSNS